MVRSCVLLLLTLSVSTALPAVGGLNMKTLSMDGKRFFLDMTKQLMSVDSLHPSDIGAQSFFLNVLDKYRKLSDHARRNMEQHVPTVTKFFKQAVENYSTNPQETFEMLSGFFQGYKEGASEALAHHGLQIVESVLEKKENN